MTQHRFYGELATWWPLISPHQEYEEEAAFAGAQLQLAQVPVREVVEFGSGGGSNAFHLKNRFSLTLVDLSAEMVEVSRQFNPECEHQVGDMRTVRLGREFDAVFLHDAIDYMLTEADLQQAFETAFVHCRPGGVVVIIPDAVTETFEAETGHGGSDAEDGSGARYLAWSYDPDPTDTETVTEYAFLLRASDGTVRAESETHHTGLFTTQTWLDLLEASGFRASTVLEETEEDRPGRVTFIGHRPLA